MHKTTTKLLFFILLTLLSTTQTVIASPFDTPVAMITSFDGKVNFENSTERQIDFGTDIFIGDILKTGINSNLLLTFYNGCRQETLDQQSLIQVGKKQSVLRSGQFKKIDILDCNIPKAVLQQSDSHLKAGLVIRGVGKTDSNFVLEPIVKNNSFHLKAWTNKGKQPAFKINSPILIHFLSNQDAYVIVNYYTSDGQLYPLTPELLLKEGKISANKLYTLGNSGVGLVAGLPTGIDNIQIIASNEPILLKNKQSDAKAYYQQLKTYINNNLQQSYSEKQIKLHITQ
ncbi:MAG: DUF4384 domain-containing protein [Pseudomonadota bacterium]